MPYYKHIAIAAYLAQKRSENLKKAWRDEQAMSHPNTTVNNSTQAHTKMEKAVSNTATQLKDAFVQKAAKYRRKRERAKLRKKEFQAKLENSKHALRDKKDLATNPKAKDAAVESPTSSHTTTTPASQGPSKTPIDEPHYTTTP